MKTSGSFFTGGGLFDMGAIAAGYTPIWGVEKDEKIAAVARLNGLPVITADVTELDLTTLARPDHFHASPPCPNFSIAKQDAEETAFDIAMAQAVRKAITYFQPDTFTLENVVGYRKSISFKIITNALSDCGYWWDATNLNAADFGVPQTRERLWVRASRGLLRGYPPPVKWKGWYEAIEDLIPNLPDTQFAPWQMARLPDEYKTFITQPAKYNPATTRGEIYRLPDQPVHTIPTNPNKMKAFILDGQANKNGELVTIRQGDQPIYTMSASAERRPARAYTGGRIVKMTVKALGRFQTVPDTYQGLTVKINGNGVPCLMAQKILETL